jgi:hypothetical protein
MNCMSDNQTRLDLRVDVLDKKDQHALALANLTTTEFVEAVLNEFRELEYLSDVPTDYQLLKAGDKTPLDANSQLRQQLGATDRLLLVEKEPALPSGTQPPSQNVYLRDQTSGKVFKLNWQPAIIGRPDKSKPQDDQLAVNLELYQAGLRVSRRQAVIIEQNGNYFIESMSRNPTVIKKENGEIIPVEATRQPLQAGDVIFLERSNISLKFIVRRAEKAPPAKAAA